MGIMLECTGSIAGGKSFTGTHYLNTNTIPLGQCLFDEGLDIIF